MSLGNTESDDREEEGEDHEGRHIDGENDEEMQEQEEEEDDDEF